MAIQFTDNEVSAILNTVKSRGFKLLIRHLDIELKHYERQLVKVTIPNPYRILPMPLGKDEIFSDANWLYILRGKVIGIKWLIAILELTARYIGLLYLLRVNRRKSFKWVLLWRGFCISIAEFISYLKGLVRKDREKRETKNTIRGDSE